MDFEGKVALITGGANGIGRAAALGFAKGGAKVVLVDRDRASGEATAGVIRQQGGEARFVVADVFVRFDHATGTCSNPAKADGSPVNAASMLASDSRVRGQR